MPHRRFEWHERIKAVEREYWSARRAVDRLSADVAHDPSALGEGPSPRDLRSADENLEEPISFACSRNSKRCPFLLESDQAAPVRKPMYFSIG